MTELHIGPAGAVTALGYDFERTVASLRSGLDRFKQIPYLGPDGEDLKAARIDGYAEAVGGIDRYESLAIKAIAPCLEGIVPSERKRIGILLGLPRPARHGVPDGLAPELSRRLASHFGLSERAVQPVQLGRPAVFWSLKQAALALDRGRLTHCIVGGVDTLVNGDSLRGLSESGEIKEQWDGFIPGEAAAFVRLSLQPVLGPWGRSASVIRGVGVATDLADGSVANPLVGVGVAEALRNAIRDAGADDSAVDLYVNDVNGARAAFEDTAMGYIRFFRTPREHLEMWHTASYVGEIGAAVGAVQLIWASAALELGFAPGPGVMLSASEADVRTAVFLVRGVGGPSSPRRAIGIGVPALHELSGSAADVANGDPGIRLRGDDLHADLLSQNFQELSWLCGVREAHHASGDPWADIDDFERRLVSHLDAIVWAGADGLRFAARRILSDDIDEISAAAMVLLSIANDHSLQKVREAMLSSEVRARAIAVILPHMPPATSDAIIQWMLSSDRSLLVTAGIRALAIAGRVTEDMLKPLIATRDPGIAAEIVHAAGSSGLTRLWDPLRVMLEHTPETRMSGVGRVALLSLAQSAVSHGMLATDRLAVEMPIAAALKCLRDGNSLLSVLPSEQLAAPAAIDACGWSGEEAARPLLLYNLESGGPSQKIAAAKALHRIYGLSCYDEVPEASRPDEPPTSRKVKRLSQRRSVWEEAIRQFDTTPRSSSRLRHGIPWSPLSALRHLERPDAAFGERLIAAWEHALVNRTAIPFYPSVFVRRQREALARLR